MMNDTPLVDFFATHRTLCIVTLAACVFLNFCLIAQLWFTHRSDSPLRKLRWSIVLLVLLLGWIFYGGFYRPPSASANEGHVEYGGAASSGADSGHGGFGHH
jgi:hypothetical protein